MQSQYALGVVKAKSLRHVGHGQFQPCGHLAQPDRIGRLPLAFAGRAAPIGLIEHHAAKSRAQDEHGDEGDSQRQPAAIDFAIGAEREAAIEIGRTHGGEMHDADGESQQQRT